MRGATNAWGIAHDALALGSSRSDHRSAAVLLGAGGILRHTRGDACVRMVVFRCRSWLQLDDPRDIMTSQGRVRSDYSSLQTHMELQMHMQLECLNHEELSTGICFKEAARST